MLTPSSSRFLKVGAILAVLGALSLLLAANGYKSVAASIFGIGFVITLAYVLSVWFQLAKSFASKDLGKSPSDGKHRSKVIHPRDA